MDMEFPGFPCTSPRFASRAEHYQALRSNVDQLWPIQLGIAVAGADGRHYGVWTFNIRFDIDVDPHTKESIAFLEAAGIDFPRHRTKGIDVLSLGKLLADSTLVGPHGHAPCWLTFSGSYDWGYLLKIITSGRALPSIASTFDQVLSVYCRKRRELRDILPNGSLETLGRKHGVKRWGCAHTAGSDALLTLELFMLHGGYDLDLDAAGDGSLQEQEEWADANWHNLDNWYAASTDSWYTGDTHNSIRDCVELESVSWGDDIWAIHNSGSVGWTTTRPKLNSKAAVWYPSRY
jgi:CCR4-NOT transcription complex subunit 7/8